MASIRFIAETAFSHEGEMSYIDKLVKEIISGRSDVVKFQVLIRPEYMPDHPMVNKCHNLILDKEEWRILFDRVKRAGKQVLVLPVDLEALNWVISENLADILEIHSVNLFRKDFYNYIEMTQPNAEIILSVSGYELSSINFIVNEYKKIADLNISLMFGFQAFPTTPEKLNLRRIGQLKERYQIEVGYADHTAWNVDSFGFVAAAVALGASTIEKHVVLEPGQERIDYNSAVNSRILEKIIGDTNLVDEAIGLRLDYFNEDEEKNYGNRRLKLVCTSQVLAGDELLPPKVNYRWSSKVGEFNEVQSFRAYGSCASSDLDENSVIA